MHLPLYQGMGQLEALRPHQLHLGAGLAGSMRESGGRGGKREETKQVGEGEEWERKEKKGRGKERKGKEGGKLDSFNVKKNKGLLGGSV